MLKMNAATPDSEMLIPMTSSVYVHGTLPKQDRFCVDIGADYFVERSVQAQEKYLVKRLKTLDQRITQLAATLTDKKKIQEVVALILAQKIQQIQQA